MSELKWCSFLLILLITTNTIENEIFQSLMTLEQIGTDFIPTNPVELIAVYTDQSNLISCYKMCNMNPNCRTFAIDNVCRLYQGSIDTGTIVVSSSLTSQVAGLHYDASFYVNYNQICNPNSLPFDRYLICTDGYLDCPTDTYWNGEMCLNQVYYGNSCNSNEMCRGDIGLICSSCNTCFCEVTAIWNDTLCISIQSTSPSLLPTDPSLLALWLFNGDAYDSMNNFNGTLIGNPSFVTGYVGQAIALSNNSYILLSYIDFYQRSFTIELWFYVTDSISGSPLFGQCSSLTYEECLHIGMNNDATLHMGFWNDDVNSLTTVDAKQWYHIAFVYDYDHRQRLIYLNGVSIELILTSPSAPRIYLGQSGNTSIGKILIFSNEYSGYMDHVSITYRVKTASEILNDATLVAYYTFDGASTLDSGPNLLHAYAVNQTFIPGRINDAIQFNSPAAYFQASGFTALGMSNTSFSIALWAKPMSTNGTLIHLSTTSNGSGSCMEILGFSISGNIIGRISNTNVNGPVLVLNVWTHITHTFSVINGIRLYINGILYASSGGGISREGFNVPVYVTLANPLLGAGSCDSGNIIDEPYAGAIDELRIYSREISAAEACALSS